MRPEGDPRRCRSQGGPPTPARGTQGTVCIEAGCHGNARAELFEGGWSRSRERVRRVEGVFLRETQPGLRLGAEEPVGRPLPGNARTQRPRGLAPSGRGRLLVTWLGPHGRGRGPGRAGVRVGPGQGPQPQWTGKKLRLEWVSERLGARSGSHALFFQRENGGPAGSKSQCIVRGSGSPIPSPSQPGSFNHPFIYTSFHPYIVPPTHSPICPSIQLHHSLWSCCGQGQGWEEG